jgi:hypothetical protein
MNCPFCGSTHLEESSNFNEYSCEFCKCEFKNDGERVRIFEDGNYKKFCENVMYSLCEKASPKVSRILVSVINQLKNNGVEEIDTILEHLQLVSANVSSEMVIGLQTADELEVVKEGIEIFTTLGNTLLKRDDLEIDLSRFTRIQESQAFYEKVYVSAIESPLVKGFKKGAVEENEAPQLDGGKTFNDIKQDVMSNGVAAVVKMGDGIGSFSLVDNNQGEIGIQGFDSIKQLKDYISYFDVPMALYVKNGSSFTKQAEGNPKQILKALAVKKENAFDGMPEAPEASADDIPATPGVIGGVSDNLPGAMDDIGDVDDIPPVANTLPIAQPPVDIGADPASTIQPPLGVPADLSPADMAAGNEPYDMDALADLLAKQYQSGQISQDADFMEALMSCQEANAMCENLGSMEETKIYELAQMVQQKLGEYEKIHNLDTGKVDIGITPDDVSVDNGEVSPEQLQEAIEILASKLSESELKDL